MKQYISKSAIIAEIERRIKETESMLPKFDQFWAGQISAFKGVLKILDTLEMEEVDSESTDEKAIAKYLFEKKGYPIDLNGNLTSYEETMKDVNQYIIYKKKQFIEKACEWLNNFYNEGTHSYLIQEDIEDFVKYMKGEQV